MGDYIVADKLYGFSLEKGDHIRIITGQDFVISDIVDIDEGYELHYTDPFEDEEYTFILGNDDMVDLLIIE